jgi:mevalonate kinase
VVLFLKKEAVTASAPAKVILFGEHFVVYGEPAIALAIDKRAYASAQLRKDKRIHINSTDLGVAGTFKGESFLTERGGSKARLKLEPVKNAVQQVLGKAERKAGVDVEINSDIPVSAGLGSSAAVATATVMAVSNLLGIELSRDQIFRMAYEAERLVHGTPSGIDPAVSSYGGTLQFQRGKDFIPLNVKANIPLVVGNTRVERSTGELVATVRLMRERYLYIIDPIIKTGGKIALDAVEALKKGDLPTVGDLMNINHALLCAVGVSHESLERLVFAARKGGAVGAKLTGGGGGGCMIALAEAGKLKRVVKSIERVGGTAFVAQKTDQGVRIEH